MLKQCFLCLETKDITLFSKQKNNKSGYARQCKKCHMNIYCKNYQNSQKGIIKKREYKYSIRGILNKKYNAMKDRVLGKSIHTCSSKGKELCSKQEFIEWFETSKEEFMVIYNIWKDNNFQRRYAPSIDRINNNKGYSVDNLQWLSNIDNLKKQFSDDYPGEKSSPFRKRINS